jgi:hypothetical protein
MQDMSDIFHPFRKKNREKVCMTVFRQAIETSDRRTSNISRLHLERWSREDRDISMSSSRMNDLRPEHSRTFFWYARLGFEGWRL